MASLKVWHFIPNPLDLSDSLVRVSYIGYSTGYAIVSFNSWVLPDTSVIEHAPIEYTVFLHVGYRESNTADWKYFDKNIRYNSEMNETHNILMFMPIPANSNYVSAHLVGNLTVSPEYNNNQWIIDLNMAAYLSDNTMQYPGRSAVLEVGVVALQGLNIYY